MSSDFYSHTSWFSCFPFKWVNGLYSCTGYQPHYILNKYPCPKCLQKHPLDPITVVAECTATAHLRQFFYPIANRAASRDRSRRKIKDQEKDAQPEKMKRKIVFSDLRNPPNNFTPLFGEVKKFRTLTKKVEQKSRDGEEAERCLPQTT